MGLNVLSILQGCLFPFQTTQEIEHQGLDTPWLCTLCSYPVMEARLNQAASPASRVFHASRGRDGANTTRTARGIQQRVHQAGHCDARGSLCAFSLVSSHFDLHCLKWRHLLARTFR